MRFSNAVNPRPAHTHTHRATLFWCSVHNPSQRQKGKPRDSDLVMDQIDLIQGSGQFLTPQDVSEWILCGRPIQLFRLTSTRASERERKHGREHKLALHSNIWALALTFFSNKRKHFYPFAFLLDVCISLEASPQRMGLLRILTLHSRKAKRATSSLLSLLLNTCAESHFIYPWRPLWRAALCALQRASRKEMCWKCLENSGPAFPGESHL